MSEIKQAYLRSAEKIYDLEEGKEVVLHFRTGDEYTGIFQGIHDDQIILKSLESDDAIGLPPELLKGYLEVIEEASTEINWDQLRDKFFNECVDISNHPSAPDQKVVNMTPHNLFEWFKTEIKEGSHEIRGTIKAEEN